MPNTNKKKVFDGVNNAGGGTADWLHKGTILREGVLRWFQRKRGTTVERRADIENPQRGRAQTKK